MSSQELSSGSLSSLSLEEEEEERVDGEEEGSVAVAQPPRGSSPRAEVVLGGGDSLEILDQVGGEAVCSGRG